MFIPRRTPAHQDLPAIGREVAPRLTPCCALVPRWGLERWRLEPLEPMGCLCPIHGLGGLCLDDSVQGRLPFLEFPFGLAEPALDDGQSALHLSSLLEVSLGVGINREGRVEGNREGPACLGVVVGDGHLGEAASDTLVVDPEEFPLPAELLPPPPPPPGPPQLRGPPPPPAPSPGPPESSLAAASGAEFAAGGACRSAAVSPSTHASLLDYLIRERAASKGRGWPAPGVVHV